MRTGVTYPASGSTRCVIGNCLHQNTINIELADSREPIKSVLMVSRASISRSSNAVSRVRRGISNLLIGEPSLGSIGSQERKIDFLGVIGVEDEAVGGAGNVGDLGYGADRAVEDVAVASCELSDRDGAFDGLLEGL